MKLKLQNQPKSINRIKATLQDMNTARITAHIALAGAKQKSQHTLQKKTIAADQKKTKTTLLGV